MKRGKIILWAATAAFLIATAAWATPSSTRFFDYSSGRRTGGIFASFTDDINYYFGQVRVKPASAFEAGIKAGFADVETGGGNSTTGAYLGLDGNVGITSIPTLGGTEIYMNIGFSSIMKSRRALNEFFLGTSGVADLSSSEFLTLRGEMGVEVAFSGGSLVNDDEVDVFLTGGLTFNIGEGANFFLQFKAGTEVAGGLGINFEF